MTEAKDELIREILRSMTESMFPHLVNFSKGLIKDSYSEDRRKNFPYKEYLEELTKSLDRQIDKVYPAYFTLYDENFSEDELKAIVKQCKLGSHATHLGLNVITKLFDFIKSEKKIIEKFLSK